MTSPLEEKNKIDAAIYAPLDSPVLGEETQVIQRKGWYQIITPSVKEISMNQVMLSHLEEGEVEKRIEETFEMYRTHNLPFQWPIGPMSSPARIENIIAPKAETSSAFRGMVLDTDHVISFPSNVTVELVTSKNFDEFMDTNILGWEAQAFYNSFRAKMERTLHHPRCRLFLARRGDEPVGTAGTVMKDGYGYLIGGVVLKSHRGFGVYRSLIHARMVDLIKEKIPLAVTWARETSSAPILEKMGFETAFKAKNYSFFILNS